MKNKEIQKKAYQKYQMDWLLTHGISITDLSLLAQRWHDEAAPFETFEDFVNAVGFDGSRYVCFAEFLTAEYQDKDYIQTLLDEADYQIYLEDISTRLQIFTSEESFLCDCKHIQFWSDSCGYLYRNFKEKISDRDLPPELFRAYDRLMPIHQKVRRFLVETPRMKGVALNWEFASDAMGFGMVVNLAKKLLDCDDLMECEIIADESQGEGTLKNYHQLYVVFPANMPVEQYTWAAAVATDLVAMYMKINNHEDIIQETASFERMTAFCRKEEL